MIVNHLYVGWLRVLTIYGGEARDKGKRAVGGFGSGAAVGGGVEGGGKVGVGEVGGSFNVR